MVLFIVVPRGRVPNFWTISGRKWFDDDALTSARLFILKSKKSSAARDPLLKIWKFVKDISITCLQYQIIDTKRSSCLFSNSNQFPSPRMILTPKERKEGEKFWTKGPYSRFFNRSIVRIRSAIEWWRRSCWYVRVKRNAPRRCGIFSKANDRDIKKGRATSCPAGGHWRGINHPREGLHFNAPGWISGEARRTVARETADSRPWAALLCIARNHTATGVSEVRTPRYRCRERVSGKPPYQDDDEEGQLSETNKLSTPSILLPFPSLQRAHVPSADSLVDSQPRRKSTRSRAAPLLVFSLAHLLWPASIPRKRRKSGWWESG